MLSPNFNFRIPIDGLGSLTDFQMRGEELRNGFAQRYGGGTRATAASRVTETFNSPDDVQEMIKKVMTTDTKNIGINISNAFNSKIGEQGSADATSSYSRAADSTETTKMSGDSALEFLNDMVVEERKNNSNAPSQQMDLEGARLYSSRSPELTLDPTMTASAAALDGISDFTRNSAFSDSIPDALRAIMDAQNGNFTGTEQPNEFDPSQLEPVPTSDTQPDPNEFQDIVGKLFDQKQDDVPENYKLSELNLSYKKVTPENDEQLDEVVVSGTRGGEKDQLDEVVVGGTRNREDDQSDEGGGDTNVSEGGAGDQPDVTPRANTPVDEEDDYNPNNPWEVFKRLYSEFYAPGSFKQVSSLMKDKEEEVKAKGLSAIGRFSLPKTQDVTTSGLMQNTNKILQGQAEKERLQDFSNAMNKSIENIAQQQQQPVVINNNTTAPMNNNQSKTQRVFTDDNTFSRLSSYDAQHPKYNYGGGP
jgi:hypothetical protein